jgi:hypothetical protein
MIKNFTGADRFIWWHGVCEFRDDPLKLGRAKIRIFGWHTEDKSEMPTMELPWSYALLPIDNGSNVVGVKEGDWVVGFFRDSLVAQQPIMVGVISGIAEDPADPSRGFFDPTPDSMLNCDELSRPEPQSITKWRIPTPKEVAGDCCGPIPDVLDEVDEVCDITRYPLEDRLKEPLCPRIQRNEEIDKTIVEFKKSDLGKSKPGDHKNSGVGTDTTYKTDVYEEPETPYEAKYPWNHVYQSEAGHYIEVDDTPQKWRLHTYHKAGTFHEIHPNGTEVNKVRRERYDFIIHDFYQTSYKSINFTSGLAMRLQSGEEMNIHACGDLNRDTEKNLNTLVRVDANTRIQNDDNKVVDIDENYKIKNIKNLIVEKETKSHHKETVYTQIDKDSNTNIKENNNIAIDKNLNIKIEEDGTIVINGDLKIAVKGKIHIASDDEYVVHSHDKISIYSRDDMRIHSDSDSTISSNRVLGLLGSDFVSCEAPFIFMNGPTYGEIYAEGALVAASLGVVITEPTIPAPITEIIEAKHDYDIKVDIEQPEDPEKQQADEKCG